MNFSEIFQRWWWIALLFITSLLVIFGIFLNICGALYELNQFHYTIFIVWIVLLLVPLFSEISIFGIGVKRELRDLRKEVKKQVKTDRGYWLGNDLASLRFQAQIVRPFDKNKEMVQWQGNQALSHMRSVKTPERHIIYLESLLHRYLAEPNERSSKEFAQSILDLQHEIASYFEGRDENDDMTS